MRTCAAMVLVSTVALGLAGSARAQVETSSVAGATRALPECAPPAAATPSVAAPYSLPFGLRGAAPVNVVRVDTVLAFAGLTTTVPVLLTASYKLIPDLAILARWGVVENVPRSGSNGFAVTNAAVGAFYGTKRTSALRAGLFLGVTIPVGSGGGNDPDPAERAAILAGVGARSALDNAMFAVNYLTIFPGIDLAYVARGLTVQLEVTGLFLIRVRGDQVDKDAVRVNATAGLHAGYFVTRAISLAVELRYQVWLVNDTVQAVADNPASDNLTVAAGPRLHVQVDDYWLRPGVSLAFGLDDPLAHSEKGQAYTLVQLDVPFFF